MLKSPLFKPSLLFWIVFLSIHKVMGDFKIKIKVETKSAIRIIFKQLYIHLKRQTFDVEVEENIQPK